MVGQVMPVNPASSVRGPRHSVRNGKTLVLAAEEARALIDAIDVSTLAGLRDWAPVGLMVYSFARVGAAIGMRVEDVYAQCRRTWIRLYEKGGKVHKMRCHHNLDETCIRTSSRRNWYRMIGGRALEAKVRTRIGCHSFRATGITEYLRKVGELEIAQQMAND